MPICCQAKYQDREAQLSNTTKMEYNQLFNLCQLPLHPPALTTVLAATTTTTTTTTATIVTAAAAAAVREGSGSRNRRVSRVVVPKKSRGILNPAIISIVLVSYITFDHTILSIMSAGKILPNGINQRVELGKTSRSLVGWAAAEPAPAPSPASGRSPASGSYRVPPINGSIFGKRSVGSPSASGTLDKKNGGQSNETNKQSSSVVVRSDSQQQQQQQQYESMADNNNNKNSNRGGNRNDNSNNYQHRVYQPKKSLSLSSKPTDYKDIITEIIEDFLALNNESNPEEVSVAFCRMIVYECGQMLSARGRTLARRKRKRIPAHDLV